MKKRLLKNSENIFYFALVIYLSLLFLMQTEFRTRLSPSAQNALQMMRYGCYALFALRICTVRYFGKKYIVSVFIAVVCVGICVLASKNRQNLFTFLIAVAAYKCDGRKILKCATAVFSVGLVTTLLFCKLGIIQNQMLAMARNRYNLGFNWVTVGPIYLMFIAFGYVALRREKITIIEIAAFEVCAYLLFRATDSRLVFWITSAFLAVLAFERIFLGYKWKLLRSKGWVLCFFPTAICIAVIIIQVLYTPSSHFWTEINDLVSNRLLQAEENFRKLPITPFGQPIEWEGLSLGEGVLTMRRYTSNNVDCSYLRILLNYGFVGLFIVLWVYTCGIYKAYIADDPVILCCYLFVLLFSVTEQWLIELTFNPFLLVAAAKLLPAGKKTIIKSYPVRIQIRQGGLG